ncbi:MAG: hypothetical protein ORN26_02885, partial [Candidatus Pacebacteria bacterium]|nr:hypothetical protein [Candidatus Paceibacterota bacterium]
EIDFLRAQIAEKEDAIKDMPRQVSKEEHFQSALKEHKERLVSDFTDNKKEFFESIEKVLKDLGKQESDKKIISLSQIMFEKGIRYTLEVVGKLDNSSLEDDFHRFLIKYILSNHNFKEKDFSKAD